MEDKCYLNRSIETLKNEIKVKDEQVNRVKILFAEEVKNHIGSEIKNELKKEFEPKKINKLKRFLNKIINIYGG